VTIDYDADSDFGETSWVAESRLGEAWSRTYVRADEGGERQRRRISTLVPSGRVSMKRTKLIRHLATKQCILLREGKKHSVYLNTANRQTAPIPRHPDVDSRLVLLICKGLGIEPPSER
jgi:hypothetical protein